MRRLRALMLLGVSALLYVGAHPPFTTGFLAYGFLIPLLFVLREGDYKKGFRLAYVMGLLSIGGLHHWLVFNVGTAVGQALAMHLLSTLYLSFAWGVFGFILAAACRRFGDKGLAAAPFLWCAMEYVQSLGEFSCAWHSVGNTQTYYLPFIQLAGVTGLFGISFWIVSINVLLFIVITRMRERKTRPLTKRDLIPALGAIGLFAASGIYGAVTMAFETPTDDTPLRVAVVQPSVEANEKWAKRNASYYQLMKQTMSIRAGGTDLLVWPETAVAFRIKDYSERLDMLRAVLKQKDAVLMGGFVDRRKTERERTASGDKPKSRAARIAARGFLNVNAVFRVEPKDGEVVSYEKLQLVPFGEYTPDSLPWLRSMMLDAGSGLYVPGEEVVVFDVPAGRHTQKPKNVKVAAVICMESNTPHIVKQFVDKGAEALVVVANDGWYDGTAEIEQHSQIAVMRAVEHRIPVIRSSNTGISSVIDPYGRIEAYLENEVAGIIERDVPTNFKRTVYSRFGNWLPHLSLIIALLVVFATLWRKFRDR